MDNGLQWNDETSLWDEGAVDRDDDDYGPIILKENGDLEITSWSTKLPFICSYNPFNINW